MQEKVTINGTSYCVGLSDVYGGVMWFCCMQSGQKAINHAVLDKERT